MRHWICFLWLGFLTGYLPAQGETASRGQQLYDKYCAQCHGIDGDGKGTAWAYLKPKPRDFTTGKYKFRSTPTGQLPTDEDLRRSIRDGMPYTGMPGWPNFSNREVEEIIAYLKTFYPGFEGADPEPMDLPAAPSFSEESVARGKEVYDAMGCARCHGELGRGDGPAAPTLVDDWGFHLPVADFTKPWTYGGGSSREDIYRTFMTGLAGTPMPSYADENALPVEDRWPLVDYVYSQAPSVEPQYATYVRAIPRAGDLNIEEGVALFEGAPMARFPLIGQIMEPGRNFYPQATDVMVRAVYNSDEIAILVEWDDMRAETSGTNAPDIRVPEFDPQEAIEAERMGTPAGQQEVDPFDPFADPAAQAETSEEQGGADREEFSDAVAVQVPSQMPGGNRKPYFLFGDPVYPVDIWFTELGSKQPQPYRGRGSDALVPGEGERFEVSGDYEQGRWSVVFKRNRRSTKAISFLEEEFVPVAFSVWDGFNRERGNKRALSNWYYVYMEPQDKPSPVGPMLQNFLIVLGVLVVIVVWVRHREDRPTNQEVDS